ncbi:UNVERIFIED_CONTAM: hypothetical protein K2H54_038173 [Gekko kuhli]
MINSAWVVSIKHIHVLNMLSPLTSVEGGGCTRKGKKQIKGKQDIPNYPLGYMLGVRYDQALYSETATHFSLYFNPVNSVWYLMNMAEVMFLHLHHTRVCVGVSVWLNSAITLKLASNYCSHMCLNQSQVSPATLKVLFCPIFNNVKVKPK